MIKASLALGLTACALLEPDLEPPPPPPTEECSTAQAHEALALVTTTDFQSGALSIVDSRCPETIREDVLVTSADPVVRTSTVGAIVLNRSTAGGNVQLLDRDLRLLQQLALDDCGPHDAVWLSSRQAYLVSCYAGPYLMLVEPTADSAVRSTSLAEFADGDGVPEMDQLALHDGSVYVTVQRLTDFVATDVGLLVVLEEASLTVASQAIALPLTNPFTNIIVAHDELYVGCAGDFVTTATFGIVLVNLTSHEAKVELSGHALGGVPTAIAKAPTPDAGLYVVIAAPDGFTTESMRLYLWRDGTLDELATVVGFSMSGLATSPSGLPWFGRRDAGNEGLWSADHGAPRAVVATGLPPFDVAFFPPAP